MSQKLFPEVIIGGRKVVATVHLQVPESEDAWVNFQVDSWKIKLHIAFADNNNDSNIKNPDFTIQPNGDYADVTFLNWNNSLPAVTKSPILIGETKHQKVYLMFSGSSVRGTRLVNISFLTEKK